MAVNRNALIAEINKRAKKKEKPKFDIKEYCFTQQYNFLRGEGTRFRTAVCSRRSGKCREINSLVKTPTGSVKIQDLKPGDKVYGYDNDGVVRICEVTQLHDQGIKEVVDLIWNKQVIATSTLDHRWLAHNTYKGKREVKRLKDFNTRDRIAEEYVPIPGGSKIVKEAYAIGALLGDGCSKGERGIVISCNDREIVEKCAQALDALEIYKRKKNFSWSIKGLKHTDAKLHYYNLWCRDKYAHEKILDLKEVRTWTRQSQLELLAGLIDTDGSVDLTKDGRLQIRLGMQAKSVIDACQMLILDLFQYKPRIEIDKRKKYKNGPIYTIRISNNKFSKRILKELPTVTKRKKWKPEYKTLNERNTNQKYTGFKLGKPRKAQCYDITINNDSHLFLDANGLIGHNTIGISADLIDTCLNEPNSLCLYITLTQQSARNIIWSDLTRIIEEYEIDVKIDNTRLSVKFPNGSKIMISGAKDRQEIEKYRGLKLKKCYIDECQSFRPYIEDLVNDIITPALRDLKGRLYLTGTPGPIPAGFFFTASTSDLWDNHHWTAFDNPYMHNIPGIESYNPNLPETNLKETLLEERTMKGISESDPGYQRETYGIWVEDLDSLVYKFDYLKNTTQSLPAVDDKNLTYIFGIDIGFNDADAIAVLAYHSKEKIMYLMEEKLVRKQDITSLVNQIKALKNQYNPVKMVMDAGALGKKVQEEIQQRHGLNIEAAEKHRKVEFIELLNDDLRNGKFKTFKGSEFEADCKLLQWDRQSRINNPEKPKVSDIYHSDITDAVLYGWRECRHYLSEPDEEKPGVFTDEYMLKIEQQEAEKVKNMLENPDEFEIMQGFEEDMDAIADDFDW
jgi:hypothetical protein